MNEFLGILLATAGGIVVVLIIVFVALAISAARDNNVRRD